MVLLVLLDQGLALFFKLVLVRLFNPLRLTSNHPGFFEERALAQIRLV